MTSLTGGKEAAQGNSELLSIATSVACELEKVLGRKFSLWSHVDRWQPIGRHEYCESSDAGFSEADLQLFSGQVFDCRSVAIPLADGRRLLAVPVQPTDHGQQLRLLVAGTVEADTAGIACALADSLLRSHSLSQQLETANQQLEDTARQLDSCIFQITTSFEELTWLRSLTEHFEICSLENGLSPAAQGSLPSLRQLIYAQELFLFGMPAKCDSGDNDGCTVPLLAFDGDGNISETAARSLIVDLADSSPKQSIVWNAPQCAPSRDNPSKIRNYILTPVLKCQEQHGWLLAINKDMPLEDPLFQSMNHEDRNLVEFGTTEAGLLGTMAVMLATHGNNVELIKEKEGLLVGVIRALVNTIDAKDAYTCGHSDRVASMSKRVAQQLGQSAEECEQAYMAGLLHDIGKIGVPDNVLGKSGQLTDEEYALIKMHPAIGAEILKHLKPFSYVLPGVLHHHETFDGRGYPSGLAGEQIPLLGRIIAVVDSYDAMTSNRTYRKGMPSEKAEAILRSGVGTQWDGHIIDAFLAALTDIHAICGIGAVAPPSCSGGAAILAGATCEPPPPLVTSC